MEVKDLTTDEPIKNTTNLTVPGQRLGVKKKITMADSHKDFKVELYEDDNIITTRKITGLEEAISGEYARLMTGENKTSPKVAFTIGADNSGIVGISRKVEALFTEIYDEDVVDEQAMDSRRRKRRAKEAKEAA